MTPSADRAVGCARVRFFGFAAVSFGALIGCGATQRSVEEHGRAIFNDATSTQYAANSFSCATCHHESVEAQDARILPGATLSGAAERASYWGGAQLDLLGAINDCRYHFMNAKQRWVADEPEAEALYAFIVGLPSPDTRAQAFTLEPVATDLAAGDAPRGQRIFEQACRSCHGEVHSGEGRLKKSIPILPEESVTSFESYGFGPKEVRVTFVEKIRHGGFLGLYGNMPPYSKEVLSDDDVAALLSFLGLYP